MNFRVSDFTQELEKEWDQIVVQKRLPLSYSFSAINYLAKARNKINLSFLAIGDNAICMVPILLSQGNLEPSMETLLNDSQLLPVIDSNIGIESMEEIFKILESRLIRYKIKIDQINFEVRRWCSYHQDNLMQNCVMENSLNTISDLDIDLVVNFCNSNSLIMRRNHIRSERRSVSLGDTVLIHSSKTDEVELEGAFARFVDCFEIRTSQPTSSELNSLMFEMLISGNATLFESMNRGRSKSFLFCDSNGVFARGWRQVNSTTAANNENPRVLLEKTAIEYFRSEGYCAYHLGEIINHSGENNPKLASINHFKLGFNPQQQRRLLVQLNAF
jgi:hypothetical protein